MLKCDREAIYKSAIDRYGYKNQLIVAIEELSELQKELCKSLRGEGCRANIIEEMADVSIMLEQLSMIYKCDSAVKLEIERKVCRLDKRIKALPKKR